MIPVPNLVILMLQGRGSARLRSAVTRSTPQPHFTQWSKQETCHKELTRKLQGSIRELGPTISTPSPCTAGYKGFLATMLCFLFLFLMFTIMLPLLALLLWVL